MRVAVVGAGVVGLATASDSAAAPRARCHRPRAVRGRTQPRSSHGRSRIVRLAYPELEWVRLAQEAMRKWRELEAETGESLLALTASSSSSRGRPRRWRRAASPTKSWTPPRSPSGSASAHAGATPLLQPEAGYPRADRANRAFFEAARSRGVTVAD